MKFRGTWILVLIALLFGAYIYFIEFKKAAKDEAVKNESEKVFAIDADKVKSIQLKNANGQFDLEKDAKGTWQLKAPLGVAADESVMSGIVSGLSTEKYDQIVSEGEVDIKTYGLDTPKDTVTITTQDGTSKTVNVGMEGALSGKVYIQRAGEKKVLFANSSFKTQIEKSLKDLRDKTIVKIAKDDVVTIELTYRKKDNNTHILLNKKDQVWNLKQPMEGKADQDATLALLSALESLKASDFPSESSNDSKVLAQYNLAKPELEIILSDKDGKPLKISVSPKKDGNIYIMVEGKPTIFQLFATAADGLNYKSDDFRDKKMPFEFPKDDVGEIILKTSSIDLDLLKKGGNWELAKPDPNKIVSQIQVSSLIDKLRQFKTNEFLVNEAPKEIEPPTGPKGSLRLKDLKGTLLIGYNWGDKTKSGKSYFIKTTKSSEVLGISLNMIDTLPGETLLEEKTKPSPAGINQPPKAGH